MRHHRLAIVLALAAAASSPALADDTIFDFVAPRPGQTGNYAASPGAIVSGGVGTLGPNAGWFDEGWAYRFAMTVSNPGAAALTEFQVSLFIDATTPEGDDVFMRAQPTGADLRAVDGITPVAEAALGAFDLSDNRGRIWFQMPTVAAGDTAMHLYFGNPTAPALDDPLATFSYGAPYASRYALEPDGVDMIIASPVGANDYATGAITGTLLAGARVTITPGNWTAGQTIAATRPFDVAFDAGAASQGVPIAFARTTLSAVINRGDPDHFRVLSPFADTSVTVRYDGVAVGTLPLTAGVAGTWEASIAVDTVVTFTAAAPIVASYRGLDTIDGIVLPPAASEVWGFQSGTPRVHAVAVDTDVVVYDSNGVITTRSIAAGGFAVLPAATGGGGDGAVMAAFATDSTTGAPAPITIIANGDGDGGDSIAFHPESELGRTWVVPADARFVLVGLTQPGVPCTMTEPDATTTTVLGTTAWPSRVKFGANTGVNVPAGSVIACGAHGFAYYEDAATDDERNLFPMEAHRKAARLPPAATLSGPLETRYDAGVEATIDTPDAVAGTAIDRWTDFRVAVLEPANTGIGYQISLDAGATYIIPTDPTTWVETTDVGVHATADAIRDALGSLDTSTGRIRVRSVLVSDDGVAKPRVDAIRVFFDQTGAATRLQWDPLPDTVLAGVGFRAGVEAVDAGGTRITGLDGTITFAASHNGEVFPLTAELTGGRAELDLKLTGAGDDITLRAVGPGGIFGESDPFDLIGPEGATLEIAGGNNQFGPTGAILGEPLAVRLLDGNGLPIGGAQITFAVIEGTGLLLPAGAASSAAITDGQGIARIDLQLGDVGPHRIRAEAADQMVELHARADVPGAKADGGGCGCRAGEASNSGAGGVWLLILAALVAGWRRRR